MKKILAVLLVFAMTMALALPAFADEPTTGGSTTGQTAGDSTINISGRYDNTQQSQEAPVVSTDIVWDSTMKFTYTKPNPGTWNDQTHQYDGQTYGGWDSTEKMPITVTNHSDVSINVALTFAKTCNEDIYGEFFTKDSTGNYTLITGSEEFLLDSAVGKSKTEADSKVLYLGIDGDPIANEGKIGTVTVTIASATRKVSTAEEFMAAAHGDTATGGHIILMNDIDIDDKCVYIQKDIIIDLNGHKLTSSSGWGTIYNLNSNTIIKNGTIENTGGVPVIGTVYSSITIMDCTLKNTGNLAMRAALGSNEDDVVIKLHNVKIDTDQTDYWFSLTVLDVHNGKCRIELSGDIEDGTGLILPREMTDAKSVSGIAAFDAHNNEFDLTQDHSSFLEITVGVGVYLHFDPTNYCDGNSYNVSSEDDGTYYVTSK